jgi:hypothetical protein
MKTINKGFLEKAFPLEHVKYAFMLKHIDRYKFYYSVRIKNASLIINTVIEPI